MFRYIYVVKCVVWIQSKYMYTYIATREEVIIENMKLHIVTKCGFISALDHEAGFGEKQIRRSDVRIRVEAII